MTRQTLNRGTVANDGTGDTLRTAALKIEQNFAEIYQKLGGNDDNLMPLISFDSSGVIFEGSTIDAFETRLIAVDPTADRVISLPNATGTLVVTDGEQELQDKTLTSPILTTPQINDTSEDHQYVVAVSELTNDRTITLPLLTGNDEFTFKDHAQTLTNKTLTEPLLNAPKIGLGLFDSNDNELLKLTKVVSAVNHLEVTSAVVTEHPSLTAAGTDANINLELGGKGTGSVDITTGLKYNTQTITGTAAISLTVPLTLANSNSSLSGSLANGSQVGEVKMVANMNSGQLQVLPTSLTGGTSVTLDEGEAATFVWDGSSWIVVNLRGGVLA